MAQVLHNLPLLTLILGVLTAIMLVINSKETNAIKRAEWLVKLYEKFYEQTHFNDIRRLIDYGTPKELASLKEALNKHNNIELEEKCVNFLNFFEFTASLWVLKRLTQQEVMMMFQYYLKQISSHDFLMDYIASNGFENLVLLLTKMEFKK